MRKIKHPAPYEEMDDLERKQLRAQWQAVMWARAANVARAIIIGILIYLFCTS